MASQLQRIHLLSAELANQIAAGEVIERPASVAKELLENALDAGATHIQIDLEKAGSQLIRITDDGCGIAKEDLPLAVQRHATSKLSEVADLDRISSLGFRGEALASICAVSKARLVSKPSAQDTAWQVTVNGQDMDATTSPASHVDGTSIEVKDLFYNTPARRRFLRSARTEYLHIEDVIHRIALSRFDVALTLQHNQKKMGHYPIAKDLQDQEQRLKRIFGSTFINNCLYLDVAASGMQLRGWISTDGFMRSQNDLQYFYLNNRIIRDKLISHAIRQAYQDVLFAGKHPAYVLFLQLDPEHVDVNVHPTKLEVRFDQSRLVHDFVVSTLRDALVNKSSAQGKADNIEPERVDFKSAVTQSKQPSLFAQATEHQGSNPEPSLAPMLLSGELSKRQKVGSGNQLHETLTPYRGEKQNSPVDMLELNTENKISVSPIFTKEPSEKLHDFGVLLGLVQQRYLLSDAAQGLFVIDLKELVCAQAYFHLLSQVRQKNIICYTLLIPETMSVNVEEMRVMLASAPKLETLGISLSSLSDHSFTLRKLPVTFKHLAAQKIFVAIKEFCCCLDDPENIDAQTLFSQLVKHIELQPSYQNHELTSLLNDLEYLEPQQLMTYFPNLYSCLSSDDLLAIVTKE